MEELKDRVTFSAKVESLIFLGDNFRREGFVLFMFCVCVLIHI